MDPRRLASVGGGATVLAGAVLVAWHAREQARQASQEQARLSERLAALEASPREVERVVERHTLVERPSTTTTDELAKQAPRPEPSEAEETDDTRIETREEYSVALANSFNSEPVDTAWATTARAEYMTAVNDALPTESKVSSLECRSAFCDLEVVHADKDASNEFLRKLFTLERNGPLARTSGGFQAAVPTPTPDGKLSYHIYIARPGVDPVIGTTAPRAMRAEPPG